MKSGGFLRKSRTTLAGAILCLAALALPSTARSSVPVYGNSGVVYTTTGGISSYTSGNLSLTYSGPFSLLIVIFCTQQVPTACVSETYGGNAMSYLAGPITATVPGASGRTAYYWVYYIQNPSNNQPLTMTYGVMANATVNSFWIDYGKTANSGCPIGAFHLNNSNFIGGCPYNNTQIKGSFNFKPQSSSSTILEYMAIADGSSQYGWNWGSGSTTYTVWPGTRRQAPLPDSNGSFLVASAFGDVSRGSTGSYTVHEGINPEWSCIGGLLWAIELLGTGSGSSATPVPGGSCGTSTPTPAAVFSPTPTPTVTATSTMSGGGFPTPTFTPVLSPTPSPNPTVYQGLNATMRPYGLEYVPFPTVTTSSGNQFYPLYMTFSAAGPATSNGPGNTAWGAPCNTSRWHIVFQNLSMATSSADSVAIETRIGPNGVNCTTGIYDTSLYSSAQSLTLPAYPQNFSSAYFWVSTSATASPSLGGVPYTERFDAVGDPRFDPYADALDYSGAVDDGLQGGYNWFWRDFSSGSSFTYADQAQDPFYAPFFAQTFDGYNSPGYTGTNFDTPKLFGLIRKGVLRSNAIYTAMTGFDSYYGGLGGEIGGDNDNDFQHGVPTAGEPWGSSTTPYDVDEIIGTTWGNAVQVNGAVYVVTGTSRTSIGWTSLPFLGELWPDGLYQSQWKGYNSTNAVWGNLTNLEEGGTAFRETMQDIPNSTNPNYRTVYHMNGFVGCATMFDGNNNNGNSNFFSHNSSSTFNATELNDGIQASSAYNISIPSIFNVTRTWGENMGTTAPPEWGYNAYSSTRTHLDVYAAATYTAGGVSSPEDWGYYTGQSSDSATTTDKSAAAVRTIDINRALSTISGNAAGGWFIVNGLAPSTADGINFVAQFAVLECLRTFHDAGVPTAAASSQNPSFTNPNNTYSGGGAAKGQTYRIPPVPLVTIAHPSPSDQEQGKTTVQVEWDLRYARWDGNLYDENYPCIDANVGPCVSSNLVPDPTLEWHDPQTVAFNVIYNIPGGISPTAWYSALTGNIVPSSEGNGYVQGAAGGYMNTSQDAIFPGSIYQTSPYQYTLNWVSVAPEKYLVRVECFRLASPTSLIPYPHYGYHQVAVDTMP